jgi:antitoxin ParD1/3/4
MNKNTSVSLGSCFDQFVQNQIEEGLFKNVSEVIRAGLKLLEEEENKVTALKNAIQDGIDSGIAHNFNPEKHLENLKSEKGKFGNHHFISTKAYLQKELDEIQNVNAKYVSIEELESRLDQII